LEEQEWAAAAQMEGQGGLACKIILTRYREANLNGLGRLNGNFIVFIHDEAAGLFHVVTDRCGMYLAYLKEGSAEGLVISSHPDVLATATGESQNWDRGSLAEFLMTSRLTFPYTYYQGIRGMEPGCVHTISLQNCRARFESRTRYFDFAFKIEPKATEWDLAEELSASFRNAIRRRTLPMFGRVGVGLSGGLDSRAILSAARSARDVQAFCLFDEENAEFKVARAIAEACGVKMVPLKRDFDYYGNSAELGVKISGGTGCITCNHFLAVRQRLRDLGIGNILTGCYCDYLFKGLALNTVESKFSGSQELADFKLPFYDGYTEVRAPYRDQVMARLEASLSPTSRIWRKE
jgi:asparagine synthase (glutamine-hydrolysing)